MKILVAKIEILVAQKKFFCMFSCYLVTHNKTPVALLLNINHKNIFLKTHSLVTLLES